MSDDIDKPYNVYMHFDFDDYDGDQMNDMRDKKGSKNLHGLFRLSRMVPQGYFHYFFSYVYEDEEDPSQNQVYTFVDDRNEVFDVSTYD